MAMSPRLLRPRATSGFDRDAQTYFNAVAQADGQQLENTVKVAINNFVIGCKADGIWSAIGACCVLIGARTLSGALRPLVGPAPTSFNFVSGDYNRKTGLIGNGVNKYLDTGYSNTANGQDNAHMSVWVTSYGSGTMNFLGAGTGANSGTSAVGHSTSATLARSRNTTNDVVKSTLDVGFVGHTRSASSQFIGRSGGLSLTITRTSQSPHNANVFAYVASGGVQFSDGRMAAYTIGANLDLALLDSRLTALYNAIGAAIQ